MAAEAPAAGTLCPTCEQNGHKHVMGEKCTTCGHSGETRAYRVSARRGPRSSTLHFEAFDRTTSDAPTLKSAFAYAKIMRERVFVSDLAVVDAKDEFDADDGISRHIFGFIGDAPVAYMRWRVVPVEDGAQYALMQRILVLKTHRRRGICKQLIAFALQDIVQKLQSLGIPISGISVHVPEVMYVVALFRKFGFTVASKIFMERSRKHVRMTLTPQAATERAPALAAMAAAAPRLGSGTGVTDAAALAATAAPGTTTAAAPPPPPPQH